jgi:tetratricopeptide (TPR) repeat protein
MRDTNFTKAGEAFQFKTSRSGAQWRGVAHACCVICGHGRQGITGGWELGTFSPFNPQEYFQHHFPKSAKILFPDYHQLIRDYTRAIERNPKDSEAYRRRGNAEYGKEEWDRAIADFNRAIELDPESHVAYMNRAWAHAKKEEYGAAIKDIQKAIQLQPNEPGYQRDMEEIKALQTTKPETR